LPKQDRILQDISQRPPALARRALLHQRDGQHIELRTARGAAEKNKDTQAQALFIEEENRRTSGQLPKEIRT
jgi:hypothetical protein